MGQCLGKSGERELLGRPWGLGVKKIRNHALQNERARRIMLLSEVPKRKFWMPP
jgi:hypothetical protein